MSVGAAPRCCLVAHVGLLPYGQALALQEAVHAARADGRIADVLVLLEHPPTITRGRSAQDAHLLARPEVLASQGIEVHDIARGGDFTIHEPGQLVGYPIIDLSARGRDLHGYLRALEEVLIHALAYHGVSGERVPGLTGVFAGGGKVAAIGVQVRRWVSLHGFAVNVANDLATFAHIVPCGIQDRPVVSLRRLVPACPTVEAFADRVAQAFGDVFGCTMEPVTLGELMRRTSA